MKCKDTQKLEFKAVKVGKSFTSRWVTSCSGLTAINDYVNHFGLLSVLDRVFPTIKNSATLAALPDSIKTVFFRADSGFFNGQLFDLLEEVRHEYLVKAKLGIMDKSEAVFCTFCSSGQK